MALMTIRNLTSSVYDNNEEQEKQILKGVDLDIEPGTVHVLMGTNGSGKSTLAHVLMGHPMHRVTGGSVSFDGKELLEMAADERAREGLFLAFQYPTVIPGLPVAAFLKKSAEAYRGVQLSVREFQKELRGLMKELKIPSSFLGRFLNEGFSGGEKKRLEVLQLMLLKPKLVILDETDSGLDVDALKQLFGSIAGYIGGTRAVTADTGAGTGTGSDSSISPGSDSSTSLGSDPSTGPGSDSSISPGSDPSTSTGSDSSTGPGSGAAKPERSLLIITHYERVLDYIHPDHVHVMSEGRIVRSGGVELGHSINTEGFEAAVR